MSTLYRKVNKSIDNPKGIVEIPDVENPFLRPCFLCLSAQTGLDKSVFGVTKIGASLARLRVRGRLNAGIDLDSMPVSFLASRLPEKENDVINFVETYFIPLTIKNGKMVDPVSLAKLFRNINILTYCDGTMKSNMIVNYLSRRLLQIGYSQEDVDFVVSQIVVIAIATSRVRESSKATTFTFKDVRDLEVLTEEEVPFYESKEKEVLISSNPRVHSYMYKGDGEHDLKKYAYEDDVMALVSLVVTSILENSIRNSNSTEFVPLNIEGIVSRLKDAIARGLSREEILKNIDDFLNYGNVIKYTPKEASILDRLDESYDRVYSTSRKLETSEDTVRKQARQLLDLQKSIRENCTDTNALRILLDALGWQVSKEQLEQIMNTPSDREVIGSSKNK